MQNTKQLPDYFIQEIQALETAYLQYDDPIKQSGFNGGSKRWFAEREPILNAIESDGELLDVGCANGYLLECLVKWGLEREVKIVPAGVDISSHLIKIAKKRLPKFAANFYVGNAWNWEPPRKFRYVYALYDCVPPECLKDYVYKLLSSFVAPGGRLIIGAYGSHSRGKMPFDVETFLKSAGLKVSGIANGGVTSITKFAWVDKC